MRRTVMVTEVEEETDTEETRTIRADLIGRIDKTTETKHHQLTTPKKLDVTDVDKLVT